VPLRHIIAQVAAAMGRPELVEFGALPIRPGDPPELVAEPRRLHEEVGFQPGFSLEAGLADTVAAFRNANG
jgi:nucleoside-diphosphate-sugar epimerase